VATATARNVKKRKKASARGAWGPSGYTNEKSKESVRNSLGQKRGGPLESREREPSLEPYARNITLGGGSNRIPLLYPTEKKRGKLST